MSYKEKQKELVDELGKLGVVYSYDARLALFWLMNYIPKHLGEQPVILKLIQELADMRTHGHEPEHKDGRYLAA